MTIAGNSMVIAVVSLDPHLHTPMYFFLFNLAVIELLYTNVVIPNTLRNLLNEDKNISFVGCFIQMFAFITLGGSECVLLGIMAYDRYVAICKPLLYTIMMNMSLCIYLVVMCWVIGCVNSLVNTVLTATLPYCHDRLIRHYFCEIPPLLKIACKNTHTNELVVFLVGGFVMVGPFLLTLISYSFVISAVIKIPSATGKRKAFSTCTSHLMVVTIFYGTIILTYLRPPSQSFYNHDHIVSLAYAIVTPLINPFIYSFRNKDVQSALRKIIQPRIFL
ncbi:olfactory receptor 5V1-like [Pseudophryne corroboree]|uniref:olfactory receptor 5V1-like n=1 Tax=Pseudophryne corroboree TaxID=495146 RepID=UPI00308201E5